MAEVAAAVEEVRGGGEGGVVADVGAGVAGDVAVGAEAGGAG